MTHGGLSRLFFCFFFLEGKVVFFINYTRIRDILPVGRLILCKILIVEVKLKEVNN